MALMVTHFEAIRFSQDAEKRNWDWWAYFFKNIRTKNLICFNSDFMGTWTPKMQGFWNSLTWRGRLWWLGRSKWRTLGKFLFEKRRRYCFWRTKGALPGVLIDTYPEYHVKMLLFSWDGTKTPVMLDQAPRNSSKGWKRILMRRTMRQWKILICSKVSKARLKGAKSRCIRGLKQCKESVDKVGNCVSCERKVVIKYVQLQASIHCRKKTLVHLESIQLIQKP